MSINAKLSQQQDQTKAKRQNSHEIAASSRTTREQFSITSRCLLDCLKAQKNYHCALSRDIMADAKRRENCLLCVDQVAFSFPNFPISLSVTDFVMQI